MAKVERLEQLRRKIKALSSAPMRSRIKQAIAEAADEIADAQRRLVPVRTGALRASIKVTFGARPAQSSAGLGAGGAAAGDPDLTAWITAGGGRSGWYARFVEFGTRPHTAGGKFKGARHPGARAQPFFYPAYRSLRRRAKSKISRAIGKAARDIASS